MKTRQQPNDAFERSVLPIPDRKAVGLTTYDAKDPDTKFPPIAQLRPPTGAPNGCITMLRPSPGGTSNSAPSPAAPSPGGHRRCGRGCPPAWSRPSVGVLLEAEGTVGVWPRNVANSTCRGTRR